MPEQLALGPQLTKMEADFERFHAANPDVYRELVRLAREARARGAAKIGLRMLWEVMRWNQHRYLPRPEDPRQDLYRLNDHYCPYYARRIMELEPDLADVFELRRLRADDPVTVDQDGRRA